MRRASIDFATWAALAAHEVDARLRVFGSSWICVLLCDSASLR